MKLLLELFPIIIFFGVYKTYDIYMATAALIFATIAQMSYIYLKEKRLELMQKITLGMIIVFGSLTLLFRDDRFIKWKPTFLYAALAIGLMIALWIYKKNFLHLLLGRQITLPSRVWNNLNIAWILYCIFMAATNGVVAAFYSTEFWVNFKLWGYIFPVVFLTAQAIYISRYLRKTDA